MNVIDTQDIWCLVNLILKLQKNLATVMNVTSGQFDFGFNVWYRFSLKVYQFYVFYTFVIHSERFILNITENF